MTGMKEGAGEDPFAEDSEPEDHDSATDGLGEAAATASTSASGSGTADSSGGRSSGSDTNRSGMQIPYKFRRDGVQEDRDRVPLFLHEETKRAERDALRELEERFDDDVSLTDLREAVVKVGLAHLDDVEGELAEWGYGMTFD